MRNNRYKDGYLPKVAYHSVKGNTEKAVSFMHSHIEKYGEINAQTLKRLEELIAIYKNGE
jgi:hypothetical protein